MKRYLLIIYIVIILVGMVGITYLVWRPIQESAISQKLHKDYLNLKEDLLSKDYYQEAISCNDLTIELFISEDNEYLSVKFSKAKYDLQDLKILVVDASEKEKNTSKTYPSVGVVSNFNSILVRAEVTANKNNKLYSDVTLWYKEPSEANKVLIYLQYQTTEAIKIYYLQIQ